jgi:hypothetical protein
MQAESNSPRWFKAWENHRFLLKLSLPVYSLHGCLGCPNLVCVLSFRFSYTWWARVEVVYCFLLFSVSPFCVSLHFSHLVTSFLNPNTVPLFLSLSYCFTFATPILLIHRVAQKKLLICHLTLVALSVPLIGENQYEVCWQEKSTGIVYTVDTEQIKAKWIWDRNLKNNHHKRMISGKMAK